MQGAASSIGSISASFSVFSKDVLTCGQPRLKLPTLLSLETLLHQLSQRSSKTYLIDLTNSLNKKHSRKKGVSVIHWINHLFRMNSTMVRTRPKRDRLQPIREMYVRIFWSSGDGIFNPCRNFEFGSSYRVMLILHFNSNGKLHAQNYTCFKLIINKKKRKAAFSMIYDNNEDITLGFVFR